MCDNRKATLLLRARILTLQYVYSPLYNHYGFGWTTSLMLASAALCPTTSSFILISQQLLLRIVQVVCKCVAHRNAQRFYHYSLLPRHASCATCCLI